MNIRDLLQRLLRREDLAADYMEEAMRALMNGAMSQAQLAAFLTALAMKGESITELRAAVQVMRDMVETLPLDPQGLVDTCGTGGDGARTFNISTAAAITAAAAGARVAKHGNRAVSGHCGSADLLRAAGAEVSLSPKAVADCILQTNLGFMFAPRFHPAMRHAAPVREELGIRTLFNKLGPLTNPSGARRQVLGVYQRELLRPLAEVLAGLNAEHVLTVHGRDGLDEISITETTDACEWHNGEMREFHISPEDFDLQRAPSSAILSVSPEHSLRIFQDALDGSDRPARDIVILNAGAALYVAGLADNIRQGTEAARTAIEEGKATAKLEQFVETTRSMKEHQ